MCLHHINIKHFAKPTTFKNGDNLFFNLSFTSNKNPMEAKVI